MSKNGARQWDSNSGRQNPAHRKLLVHSEVQAVTSRKEFKIAIFSLSTANLALKFIKASNPTSYLLSGYLTIILYDFMPSTPTVFIFQVLKTDCREELNRRAEEKLSHSPGFLALPRVNFQSKASFFYLYLRLKKYANG